MRRNLSEDTMSSYSGEKPKYCSSSNNKKGHSWFECSKGSFGKGSFNNSNNKRLLVVINVLGSAGPLKFVVNEEDFVGGVIDTSLKLYAKERRLPVLGSDSTNFLLYCANAASDALSPWDEIGSCGGRSFVLCKKPEQPTNMTEARSQMISQKRALSAHGTRLDHVEGGALFSAKKPEQPTNMTEARSKIISQKQGGSWRAWPINL